MLGTRPRRTVLGRYSTSSLNNFGPFSVVPFCELPLETWESVWAGNVTATYLATQAVTPAMIGRRGRIDDTAAVGQPAQPLDLRPG